MPSPTSSPKPRLVVLNATCLDVVEDHRAWIEEQGVELVADQRFRRLQLDQVDHVLQGASAVILPAPIRTLPFAEHMERHRDTLRVLSIAASGYDWLDVAAATCRGIVVTNVVGGIGSEVVADMAWGLMLAVARQIPFHDREMQASRHERRLGQSLWGKTLGVVGLGHIGRAVVHRAGGFNMKVLAASRHAQPEFVEAHRVEVVSLDDLLTRSDFISLHVRLTDENARMIGPRELGLMKPTAILINTARHELIDEAALTQALLEGRLGGAGLDDPPSDAKSPLLGLPNVVFTPHLGNRAFEGVNGVFRTAVENVLAVLRGERPALVVNPEVFKDDLQITQIDTD